MKCFQFLVRKTNYKTPKPSNRKSDRIALPSTKCSLRKDRVSLKGKGEECLGGMFKTFYFQVFSFCGKKRLKRSICFKQVDKTDATNEKSAK